MSDENKVRVYAPIILNEHVEKEAQEKASILALPEEGQRDLLYMSSILVSAGTNKNGAHFLPSEMMKAHNTVVNKAIDLEHEEDKVIGHMYESVFMYKDGTSFDPVTLMSEYSDAQRNVDGLDIDLAVAGVIHKMRFPEIAEEIAAGQWKVSMECYFKNFDILVGDNTILTTDEAKSLGYDPDELIGGFVRVMAGTKALGKQLVARVLRTITFSGMGMVLNPANPHSIVMETAAHKEIMDRDDLVIDLENIDNLRGHKVELSSDEEGVEEPVREVAVINDVPKGITIVNSEGAVLDEAMQIEVDAETGGITRIVSFNSKEDAAARWTGRGMGSPGSVETFPANLCKSFKKRLTKYGALDQSEGAVIHEHWCALFDSSCPVIGASAKAPECLRNQLNRTTKPEWDNPAVKSIESSTSASDISARGDQIARILKEADGLKDSLRNYTVVSTVKNFQINSQPIAAASVVTADKVIRYKNKMEAFETARVLEPSAPREKVDGFILQVGPEPEVLLVGDDRDAAIEKAYNILEAQDTEVFLSKLQSKFGDVLVTKDQLVLTRKCE